MKKFFAIILTLIFLFLTAFSAFAFYRDENIFYCHKNNAQKIALTFDDGPHPKYTPKILEILKKYDIKATFFVIGQNVEFYPGIVEQIIADGHEIGNHTYRHKHTKMLTDEIFEQDVSKCDIMIYDNCDYEIKIFRPPEGYVDEKVKKIADELGYSIILWNIDTKDWAHATPYQIEKNVINNISAGDIILMHDYVSGENSTIEALERIIPKLLDENYKFVKVSELIEND